MVRARTSYATASIAWDAETLHTIARGSRAQGPRHVIAGSRLVVGAGNHRHEQASKIIEYFREQWGRSGQRLAS